VDARPDSNGDPTLTTALIDAVGADDVLIDADLRSGYETDWTGRYGGPSMAVIRPRTTDALAAVMRACNDHGAVVIPQAGNTGLVGGSVPPAGQESVQDSERPTVIVSMRSFDDIGPVDRDAMQVTVGAGVTLARWQAAARAAGLDAPLDFAARDSATIGGAIATNAGGSRVVRFGTMRQQVVGIEAVLADGSVVGSLSGLPKETAGMHWPSLLVGSEGTLGIVTRARLRLVPRFAHTVTAFVSLKSIGDALDLLRRLRTSGAPLDAVEVIQPEALDLVVDHLGRPSPAAPPSATGTVVIVECAANHDPTDELVATLADASIVDTAIATDPRQREAMLEFRDRMTEAIAAASTRLGTPTFKLDVAVPLSALDDLLSEAEQAALDDGCRLISFGHLAEGNIHLNHLGALDPDRIARRVLGEVARLGGTISAEHGIGRAKAAHLHLIRSADDLRAQQAIKTALDPNAILNPGVVIETRER
jgi:FAD/FMN-containing dehydrogenase